MDDLAKFDSFNLLERQSLASAIVRFDVTALRARLRSHADYLTCCDPIYGFSEQAKGVATGLFDDTNTQHGVYQRLMQAITRLAMVSYICFQDFLDLLAGDDKRR